MMSGSQVRPPPGPARDRPGGGLVRVLLWINMLVAMCSGGALASSVVLSLHPALASPLPARSAAAACLLLPALAVAALVLAVLLAAVRLTPALLFSYAALSLALAVTGGCAGCWLALQLARALLAHKWLAARAGLGAVVHAVSGGVVGARLAATYAPYSATIVVGAAWAALTGMAQLVGAAVAVVAARRFPRGDNVHLI